MREMEIGVYTELPDAKGCVRVGTLWSGGCRASQTVNFEYTPAWISHPQGYALEPALPLVRGVQYTPKKLFGSMADSCPDRWGRTLIKRAEAARARAEGEAPRRLLETDYLLRVNDETRQGALRYSVNSGATFLDNEAACAVPPLLDLRKLQYAVDNVVEDKAGNTDLKLLLVPGSSLGGAWPKACVRDEQRRLCIAKFSRADQDYDVVAWEAVALRLAGAAGLNVPSIRLETLLVGGNRRHVLLVEKFDRSEGNRRIPYISAMTMLDAEDGERRSYLELAEAMLQHGANPQRDLPELWRRAAFSLMVSNTDDHLRNHGFLRSHSEGWNLSPLFDVNPTPADIAPRVLTTPLTPDGDEVSRDSLLEWAGLFRLRLQEAKESWSQLEAAVSSWRAAASQFRIPKKEQDRMAESFSIRG